MDLTFTVRGRPVPQGGLTAYNRGDRAVLTHKRRPELEAWRAAIATEARAVIGDAPLIDGPVAVDLVFRFPRPASHYLPANGRRPVRELRLDAPEYHTSRPDLDKCERAGLDALTAVVFGDDCQVADLHGVKRYVAETGGPGVEVRIRSLETTR